MIMLTTSSESNTTKGAAEAVPPEHLRISGDPRILVGGSFLAQESALCEAYVIIAKQAEEIANIKTTLSVSRAFWEASTRDALRDRDEAYAREIREILKTTTPL